MKNEKAWYKLDQMGKLYSTIISSRATTIYRISVTLTTAVEPSVLQQALESTLDIFPFFKVQLKRGVFWYYFESSHRTPRVEEERFYPCMSLPIKKRGTFPFRVLYYKKRISVEFSHSLADGTGAFLFLKEFISQYLHLKEALPITARKIDTERIRAMTENAFQRYYEKQVPTLRSVKQNAFKLPLKIDKKGRYHITTGIIPSEAIKQKAKEYKVSLTIFLTAIYIDVLLNIQKQIRRRKKPIVVNVPVNMRAFFQTETVRNFFVSITPTVDARLGDYTFEEIINDVRLEFSRLLSKKALKQYLKRGARQEQFLPLRIIPLVIKDLIGPYIYASYGEKRYTSGLSNMGILELPSEIEQYVERIDAYPPPSIGNKVKAVINSYKQETYISFGNLSSDRLLEREFFRAIRSMGIPVKIETNEECE